MGLQFTEGKYVIETAEDLAKALGLMAGLKESIAAEVESIEQLRRAATSFMTSNDILVAKGSDGKYWRVVRSFSPVWVGTIEDAPSNFRGTPLKDLVGDREITITRRGQKIKMKLWNYLTRRVVNPEQLEKAFKRGYITHEEVSPAFMQQPRAAYIRQGKEDSDGEL